MSSRFVTTPIAILLLGSFIASTVFFVVPKKASAAGISGAVSCLLGIGSAAAIPSIVGVPVGGIGIGTIVANTGTAAGATTGSCVYETIFKPLFRFIARMILQQLTQSIVNWINNTPGKGMINASSFVQNLAQNLRNAADAAAISFINSAATAFLSPFGSALSSALRAGYYQQTSLAGFFASNRSTLSRYSPNVRAFLSGRYSQGGVAAWFALTTRRENNPYVLYPAALSQIAALAGSGVGGATGKRLAELTWGNGFQSWCGTTDTGASAADEAAANYAACAESCNRNGYTQTCINACVADYQGATGTTGARAGVSPGDACYNRDGTPGRIETPGSVIHGYTQKAVVGAGIDQLITAQDLDDALGAIVQALAGQILGGAMGLLGASNSSSQSYQNIAGYSSSNTSTAGSAVGLAQTKQTQLTNFTNAWNSMTAAANTASTTLQSLIDFCTTSAASTPNNQTFVSAATAQAAEARTALATQVVPIFSQARAALATVSGTPAIILRVQQNATAAPSTEAAAQLTADIQQLLAAPPSGADVADAQSNATPNGLANANPAGSLTGIYGPIADRMSLITANADALKTTACTPPAPNGGGGGGDGGSGD